MYSTIITGQDQAICHLFFHCCLGDGEFAGEEMDALSAILVNLGIAPKMNIKDQLLSYRSYKDSIGDEAAYLRHLVKTINPVNELALYSYCVELCLSDRRLDAREEALMDKLAAILEIGDEDELTMNKLLAQRKAVALDKIF